MKNYIVSEAVNRLKKEFSINAALIDEIPSEDNLIKGLVLENWEEKTAQIAVMEFIKFIEDIVNEINNQIGN